MTSLKKTRFSGKEIFLITSNKRYIYLTVKISETLSNNPLGYFGCAYFSQPMEKETTYNGHFKFGIADPVTISIIIKSNKTWGTEDMF